MVRACILPALIAGGLLAAASVPRPCHRPLVFEQNRGQAPPQVKWIGLGSGYQLLLGEEEAAIVFAEQTDPHPGSMRPARPVLPRPQVKYRVVHMKLAGGRPWKDITDEEADSVPQIPPHARVRVANVYAGIDLVLQGRGGNLGYEFVVAPGGDPRQIEVLFEGMKRMRVDHPSGDLVLTMPGGSELHQLHPKVYQQIGNQRVEIAGGYELLDPARAAFRLAAYDKSRPLMIDPTVDFTTFFGGGAAARPVSLTQTDPASPFQVTGTLAE